MATIDISARVLGDTELAQTLARLSSHDIPKAIRAGVRDAARAGRTTMAKSIGQRYSLTAGRIKQDVSTGMQLNFSMRSTGVFPAMAIQMTSIGEESGSLDSMLDKVAEYYEAEVDNMVDNLTTLMEPMIMAVLGVLVGGLIIAMYLPIFQLGAVV